MYRRGYGSRLGRWRAALGLDEPAIAGLLALLWLTTGAFVAGHFGNRLLGVPWHPSFDLGTDRGYAETFFQVITAWAVILLGIAAVRRRSPLLAVFAISSAYLLVDDYFLVHEGTGVVIAEWLGSVPAEPGTTVHLGEALYLGAVGLVVVTSFALAYRGARPDARRIALTLAALFAVLAAFGVVVDMLHALVAGPTVVDVAFTAAEDGGEIAAMSLIVAFGFSLAFGRDSGRDPGRARVQPGTLHEAPATARPIEVDREVGSPV